MSMMVGNRGGQKADIKMTPLIDVLLVLIIIFMVITPIAPRGLEALVPKPASSPPPANAVSRDLVITVNADGTMEINRQPIERAALAERLDALYRTAGGAYLFVRASRDLEFREVVRVMDIARGAGWGRIGLMTQ